MKTKRDSFTGERPIFTGSPAIVPGGFNLDVVKQRFLANDVIAGGSLAIYNETTRLVNIVKTGSVSVIDAVDAKILTLKVDEFYAPCFNVGDKVLETISGLFAGAPSIVSVVKTENSCVITLSAAIVGLAVGDTLIEVVDDGAGNAAMIGNANSLTLDDITVSDLGETAVDVTADTMQYALYERRVLPIPASQKDATGSFLKVNPHIKFTQSY